MDIKIIENCAKASLSGGVVDRELFTDAIRSELCEWGKCEVSFCAVSIGYDGTIIYTVAITHGDETCEACVSVDMSENIRVKWVEE